MKKKVVLITGATGYIGQFTKQLLLERNYVVHAVTSGEISAELDDGVVWHQADLLEPAEVKLLVEKIRPSHLLHFAWYVEHGKFWNSARNLDWLRASLNLAQRFSEIGGTRMVTAGSCVEYDWGSVSPFSEYETPVRSQSLYGRSKAALSTTLEKFAEVAGFSFASGKIFFLFGGNESPNRLIPSVICSLLENRVAKTSHGNQIRDFLHVEDVAEAFVELLDSDVCGPVNIGSGEGVKLRVIIETIAEIIGKPELLKLGAIQPGADEPPEIVANTSRLNQEVGFVDESSLREKLEETVGWWRRHLGK